MCYAPAATSLAEMTSAWVHSEKSASACAHRGLMNRVGSSQPAAPAAAALPAPHSQHLDQLARTVQDSNTKLIGVPDCEIHATSRVATRA